MIKSRKDKKYLQVRGNLIRLVFMATITKESLAHLAKLVRLELSDKEIEKFVNDLGNILNYFKELQAVDTTGVELMTGGTNLINIMRNDVIKNDRIGEQKNVIDAFPDKEKGYLRTPGVFSS